MKPKASININDSDSQFSGDDEDEVNVSDSNDKQTNENDDANDKEEETTTIKKIRVVNRKPMPKLDPLRLSGQRGLKCLLEDLEKLKPKGPGHEFQDLDRLINKYEYWAHRLFPKIKFVDFIEKLEKLGDKKEVKGLLSRIRLEGEKNDEEETNEIEIDPAILEEVTIN